MLKYFLPIILVFMLVSSCKNENKAKLEYDKLKHEVMHNSITTVDLSDTADIFDNDAYNPKMDSIEPYLDSLKETFENDSAMIKKLGMDSNILDQHVVHDSSISNKKDSFTADIKKINAEELKALKYNLKQIHDSDSILKSTYERKSGRADSRVWARINKTDQRLYLYIDGTIVDTFKVSTGTRSHETPLLDMQPRGPLFQKYTSKKYPGGNYNGLGNMPYVVFIKGGYAIHGTTRGNIPRLGKKASHGCVRLHPDNAKIFNELVRKAGLKNTWVTIEK